MDWMPNPQIALPSFLLDDSAPGLNPHAILP
jgi:hypothetical protein